MQDKSKNRLMGFTCILVSAFFTGSAPAVTQLSFKYGVSVETALSTRFFIGAVFIWIFIFCKKSKINVGKKNVFFLVLVGVLGVFATILMNESYQYLPAAIASILVFSYIIIVNLIDICLGREKATTSRFVCLILAVIGVIAIIWTPGEGMAFKAAGIALALMAALFYALNTVSVGAKRFHAVSAEVLAGYTVIIPAVVNCTRCFLASEPLFPSLPHQWACLLFLGLGSTFFGNILYMTAIKKIGVSDTAITNTLEPIYSYMAGIILMHDIISMKSVLGGVIILSAIAFLNYSNKKQSRVDN